MTQVCQTCNHPNRLEIDRAICRGVSLSQIARKYGVSRDSVGYHAEHHLSRQLAKAWEKKELAEGMDLLGRIEGILSKAETIFNRNYAKQKDGMALKALAEQRCTIELLAKIAAYMHETRAMELDASQGNYEARRRQEEKEFVSMALDRLNEAEADLWVALLEKIHGQRHDDIVPAPPEKWPKPARRPAKEPASQDSLESHEEPEPESEAPLTLRRTKFPQPKQVKDIPAKPIPARGSRVGRL